jgi:uncharacterized protein
MIIDDMREKIMNGSPLDDMLVIDSHSHIGHYPLFYTRDNSLPEMVKQMDRYGMDIICVSHTKGICCGSQDANEATAESILSYPGRILGYCFINGNDSPEIIEEQIKKYMRIKGFIGVKIYPGAGHDGKNHNTSINDENYGILWELAAKMGFIILSHTGGSGSDPSAPGRFEKILMRYPAIRLIVGHSGATYRGQLETLSLIRRYQNVYYDMTASSEGDVWLEDIVSQIGYDRVLYGSDFGFFGPGTEIGRVGYANIPYVAKEAIMGLNMKDLLEGSGLGIKI